MLLESQNGPPAQARYHRLLKKNKQAGVTNHCKLQVINATMTKNRQVEKAGIAEKNWKIVYKLPSKIRYKMAKKKKNR